MKILGLNFGHDAGVSIIVDGVFESHWEKERHVRIKHAMGHSQLRLEAGEYISQSRARFIRWFPIAFGLARSTNLLRWL